MKSVLQSVTRKVARGRRGQLYALSDFTTLGSNRAVGRALGHLCKQEWLMLLGRGLYLKPLSQEPPGRGLPTVEAIVSQLVRRSGEKVQPIGAESARRLGLSLQMPLRPIFEGVAKRRTLHLGALEVKLRPARKAVLPLLGRPAGEALSALLFLGQGGVTPKVVRQVRARLAPEEYKALQEGARPGWLRECLQ